MAQRSVRLRAWLTALKQHVDLPERPAPHEVDEALETGVVWLRWTQLAEPNEDRMTEFLEAYEALELLALLADANHDEWLCTITQVWPRATKRWVSAFYPRRFTLGIAVHVARSGELSKWAERAFLSDVVVAECSGDYNPAYTELKRSLPVIGCRSSTSISVRVVLVDHVDELDNLALLLFEAVQLAAVQAARKAIDASCPRYWKPLFRLVEVQTPVMKRNFSERTILSARDLTALGVRVPTVCLMAMEQSVGFPYLLNISTLHRLIACPDKHECPPVTRVVVNMEASRQTLDSIFSSILPSQFLRELVLTTDMPHDDEEQDEEQDAVRELDLERLMQWLALCVFGRFGCPSLEKITLNMSGLQESDILTLERQLSEGTALPALFLGANQICFPQQLVATASNFVITDSPAALPAVARPKIQLNTPFERLPILTMDREYVSVVLPGWGQAWVHYSDLTLGLLSEQDERASVKSRSVHHIVLESDNEAIVLQLLRVVGVGATGISALTLKWQMDPDALSPDWSRNVCLVCPNLEELYLDKVSGAALNELVLCYGDGTCHARRLVLDAVSVGPNPSRLNSLFKSLTDSDHGLYRHLRELTLKICRPSTISHQRRFMSRVIKMLKVNALLTNLEISFQCRTKEERKMTHRALATFDTIFDRFNGSNVAVPVAPLRTKRKLAFLSVIRDDTPSCRSVLDATMVGRIFQFAAMCKKRRVLLTVE